MNGTNPSLPTLARPRRIDGKGDRQVQWPEGWAQGPQLLHVITGHAPRTPHSEASTQTAVSRIAVVTGTCTNVQRRHLISHPSGLLGEGCQPPPPPAPGQALLAEAGARSDAQQKRVLGGLPLKLTISYGCPHAGRRAHASQPVVGTTSVTNPSRGSHLPSPSNAPRAELYTLHGSTRII